MVIIEIAEKIVDHWVHFAVHMKNTVHVVNSHVEHPHKTIVNCIRNTIKKLIRLSRLQNRLKTKFDDMSIIMILNFVE